MKHFTHIADLGVDGVAKVIELAGHLKKVPVDSAFTSKILGMLFFNPSLRTRVSFETAMLRSGGNAIVLNVDGSIWKMEDRDGIVMDSDCPEHIKEAVPVLARYVDALAVRTFAANVDWNTDELDTLIRQIKKHSTVPVISMESTREHPCQGLADMLTIKEMTGDLNRCPVTLSWAPHIKSLPLAVPHSFLLSAAACGCDITVAHPPGFDLHPKIIKQASQYADITGASIKFTNDQQDACDNASVIYAKSWAPNLPGVDPAGLIRENSDWIIDKSKLGSGDSKARFMHCLPLRRNVVATDDVLDSLESAVVDQAENRHHVQRAVLNHIFEGASK